jgi:hypothetical protein
MQLDSERQRAGTNPLLVVSAGMYVRPPAVYSDRLESKRGDSAPGHLKIARADQQVDVVV